VEKGRDLTRNNSPANVIHPPRMPIRGRVLALVGVVLIALNLRLAITSLSVLYDAIGKEVTGFSVHIIGVLPLICFSIFGLLAHNVAERIGFKNSLLIAMLAVWVGTALRAFSSEIWTFAACTMVAGAGMAFGNVLLFPVIKKYFPEHIGGMTATFSVLLAVSSAVAPSLAIPVADAVHWRVSIGSGGASSR
jgi:MFS transporter, CP family, cyanate transporter